MNQRALLSWLRPLVGAGVACLLLLLLADALANAGPPAGTTASAAGRDLDGRPPATAGVLTSTSGYTSFLPLLFGPLRPLTCPGYQATYYNNPTLQGTPAFEQCEPAPIHYAWGPAGPGHGLGAENFSVRWAGRVHFEAGAYTFSARTDDGMRAWLGNELIIDAWLDQPATDYRATRTLGAGDYDVRVEYYQKAGATAAQFGWLPARSGSGVVISQRQGADKCEFPRPGDLLAWWNKSPYWEFNIYIGGSLRACAQPNLTHENLLAASDQGWNFIPTWVGPQAPCADHADKISADVNVAYNQGLSEADAAANRGQTLGLTALGAASSSIIYYDVEYYAGDAACHDAVKSFLAGWTARLHARGLRAGAYGTPSGIYSAGGVQVDAQPDDIWAAVWTDNTYNAAAGVWDLPGIPDTLWTDHQRLHQYTGGHDEVWGGVTFNVDSNAIDGHVAGINPHPAAATLAARAEAGPAGLAAARGVQAAQLLPGGQGWSLAGNRLWWTRAAGSQWADVTPDIVPGQALLAAHYHDAEHGWLLVAAPSLDGPEASRALLIGGTEDGGRSWFTAPLPPLPADPGNLAHSAAFFSSVDTGTGWLALRLPTGSNFSRGALFGTTNGGRAWTALPLPVGGPVSFADDLHGWVAGGPAGDQLWATRDGGHSWERHTAGPARSPGAAIFYGLPFFEDTRRGLLPVTVGEDANSRVEFYQTSDGGQTWQAAGTARLAGGVPGAAVPVSIPAAAERMVADPRNGALFVANPPAAEARGASGAPQLQGAVDLQFTDAEHGWALVAPGACSGDKARAAAGAFRCSTQPTLLSTSDGGATWTSVAP